MERFPSNFKLLFFTLICLQPLLVSAQNRIEYPYVRSWGTYLSQVNLNEKWSASFELHERTNKFIGEHGQFLFRPSIDYHFNKQFVLSGGYTFISTQGLNQTRSFVENNLWQQLLLKSRLKSIHFQSRFRLEQRWIESIVVSNTSLYKNRFRYRLNAKVEVSKIGKRSLFFQIFDEIWFDFNNGWMSGSFGRNWLYAGFGVDLNKDFNFHIGYLNQLDEARSKLINTNIIQLTVQKNLSLSKK